MSDTKSPKNAANHSSGTSEQPYSERVISTALAALEELLGTTTPIEHKHSHRQAANDLFDALPHLRHMTAFIYEYREQLAAGVEDGTDRKPEYNWRDLAYLDTLLLSEEVQAALSYFDDAAAEPAGRKRIFCRPVLTLL